MAEEAVPDVGVPVLPDLPEDPALAFRALLTVLNDMRQENEVFRMAAAAAQEAERRRVNELFAALPRVPPLPLPLRPVTPPVGPWGGVPPAVPYGHLPLPSSTASTASLPASPPSSPPTSKPVSLRSLLATPSPRVPAGAPRSEAPSVAFDEFEDGDIATTSRNFQTFLRGAKELQFAGGPKDEVLQWLKNLVQLGRTCGVN